MDASLLSKLETSVECDICHDPVEDPRLLPCHHTYCRSCIDDLLKFDENGAATVKCPKNCNGETLIKQDETTKILPNNFALSNVLDLIKESKQSNADNGKTKCGCMLNISKWCISCKDMFCKDCYQTHFCSKKSCINGSYNLVKESFQPFCEEHGAHIKHVCLDCDHRFICCYCRNREHRSHNIDTLDQTANKYKKGYLVYLDNINSDDLKFSYDDVITNVFKFKEELERELNARIHLKLSLYIKKLSKEKHEILTQYKQAADNYKQSLPDLQLTHKTFKESLDSAKEYLKKHSAFETLALKEDLNKQFESITKLNVFKVSCNEDGSSDSLGILHTEILKKDLSEGNVAFDHDINLESKDNYLDILCKSSLIIQELQKSSRKSYISNDEEQRYLRYNKEDINALKLNKDMQRLKKIITVNPKIVSDNLSSFIHLTIQQNQVNALDLLLKHYPDAVRKMTREIIKGDDNNIPLLGAVDAGATECVKVLLKCNTNIQLRSFCLHRAAEKGHHEILDILLQNGADTNIKGCNGQTPLMKAATNGHKECLRVLLQNNANIQVRENYNNTCLHYAALKGHQEIINILLNHGADINSKGYLGKTLLMNAADNGHKKCVKVLLQNNANIQLKDYWKNTCLHYAASNGHHEIIKIFLNNGANIESKGYRGRTPLMYAALNGHKVCVSILLQNGANVNSNDTFNDSCLHIAADKGYHEIIYILINSAAGINSIGHHGRTALINAARNGHEECVKILLQYFADINVMDYSKNTCLHYAAEYGHREIINILLNYGADINSKGFEKETPLMKAAKFGDKACVNILSKKRQYSKDPNRRRVLNKQGGRKT